jgi:hypothetical protein
MAGSQEFGLKRKSPVSEIASHGWPSFIRTTLPDVRVSAITTRMSSARELDEEVACKQRGEMKDGFYLFVTVVMTTGV